MQETEAKTAGPSAPTGVGGAIGKVVAERWVERWQRHGAYVQAAMWVIGTDGTGSRACGRLLVTDEQRLLVAPATLRFADPYMIAAPLFHATNFHLVLADADDSPTVFRVTYPQVVLELVVRDDSMEAQVERRRAEILAVFEREKCAGNVRIFSAATVDQTSKDTGAISFVIDINTKLTGNARRELELATCRRLETALGKLLGRKYKVKNITAYNPKGRRLVEQAARPLSGESMA
jgi:hypothetical protein